MSSPIADESALLAAYAKVRAENSEERWFLLKYDEKMIVLDSTGIVYDEFLAKLGDDERAYGYVLVETGDEMSIRRKFVFVTWIGPNVSPLKKAKVSTDKAFVKQHITEFSFEQLADEKSELNYETLKNKAEKASGAAYGTGK